MFGQEPLLIIILHSRTSNECQLPTWERTKTYTRPCLCPCLSFSLWSLFLSLSLVELWTGVSLLVCPWPEFHKLMVFKHQLVLLFLLPLWWCYLCSQIPVALRHFTNTSCFPCSLSPPADRSSTHSSTDWDAVVPLNLLFKIPSSTISGLIANTTKSNSPWTFLTSLWSCSSSENCFLCHVSVCWFIPRLQ